VNIALITLQTLVIDVMVDVRVRVLAVMMMDAMEDVLVDAMEAEILTGGEILMAGLALEGVTIGIRYLNGEMTWRAMSRSCLCAREIENKLGQRPLLWNILASQFE